jgi:hypothetical protein
MFVTTTQTPRPRSLSGCGINIDRRFDALQVFWA